MDTFLLNAQRIFDVACAGGSTNLAEFALLVGRDGGIRMIMESEMSLFAVMAHHDAETAYRVTRSSNGVRVTGSKGARRCELAESSPRASLDSVLRDQPLYRITSPLSISAGE